MMFEHNIVKNLSWPEANQLTIYNRGQGFELGATVKQIQVVVRAGLEPGTAGLWVWCADHWDMLPLVLWLTEWVQRASKSLQLKNKQKNY